MKTRKITKRTEPRDKAVCKRGADGTQCRKLCVAPYEGHLLLVCAEENDGILLESHRPYSDSDVGVDDLSFDLWATPADCPRADEFATVRRLREL